MEVKYYEESPESFKTAWLDDENPKGIEIHIYEFKNKVIPEEGDNPSEKKWWEHNDKSKKYIPTTDTIVDETKSYFELSSNDLIYTDDDIVDDSFKLKKSLQSGSNIDFTGCISSSLEFKVDNDFKYLKDQKVYVDLTVSAPYSKQIISGPLGTFYVGGYGYIPDNWDINNSACLEEIYTFGSYNTIFSVDSQPGVEMNANQYLELCRSQEHNKGIRAGIFIPSQSSDILWKIRVFTGIIEEVKRDKSRDLVRTVTANDFLHRLLDNYDVTDWYVWQYGDSDSSNIPPELLKHPIYDLRNSFWNFIANGENETTPDGKTITKKGEGWDQVSDAHLVNDSVWIPKTLNVNPIDYDNWVGGELTGGPIEKGTEKDLGTDWNVTDIVARNEIIDIGKNGGGLFSYGWYPVTPVGNENPMVEDWYEYKYVDNQWRYVQTTDATVQQATYDKVTPETIIDEEGKTVYTQSPVSMGWYEFQNGQYIATNDPKVISTKQYYSKTSDSKTYYTSSTKETNYREYLHDCDTIYESSGNPICAIPVHVRVPAEEQEKVRETQITAATVLQAFCQFNGVFGFVNGYGQFDYKKLDMSNPLEIEEQYQIEVGHSDIEMPKITGVVIFDKTSEEYGSDQIHTEFGDVKNGKKGSALAYYPSGDRTLIEGDDANPFTIDDNFLMNSFEHRDAMQVAENLYNQVSNLTMRNCNITIKAMPWLECGQPICFYAPTENTLFPSETLIPSDTLYPRDYEKITTMMMNIEISGTGLLKESIECEVEDLGGEIVSLNEVITDEMFQRTIGNSRIYSSFLQTAEKIEMKVANLDTGFTSKITQLANKIDLEINGPSGILSRISLNESGIQMLGKTIELTAEKVDINASEIVDINTRLLSVEAAEVDIKADKVSFTDLATGGKTVIEGSNIRTGSLSCDRLQMGAVMLDGEVYNMAWRKVMLYDTKRMIIGKTLGLTVDPNKDDTAYYLHVTKDESGYVTDVSIDNTALGADSTILVINSFNLLKGVSSNAGYLAIGPDQDIGNNRAVWWQYDSSGEGSARRLIMASEDKGSY